MVLKQIVTRNLQNHREVVIDLPPSGLIVFTGNNSNGKSVIRKALEALVKGTISDPYTRADLVNRKSIAGEIELMRDDGVKLLGHIQREANATYVELHRSANDVVRRYSSDKAYKDLVREFGWQYDDVTDIAIQLAKAKDALLFYNTPLKTNGRVLASATTDPAAEIAAENMTKTISEVKKYRDLYSAKLTTLFQTLRGLVIEDVDPMQEKLDKLNRYYRNLSCVYIPTIPEIHGVPDVKLTNLYVPKIPTIKYPKLYGLKCNIPDILPVARELKALNERKCPTCGRRFDDHDSTNTVCA